MEPKNFKNLDDMRSWLQDDQQKREPAPYVPLPYEYPMGGGGDPEKFYFEVISGMVEKAKGGSKSLDKLLVDHLLKVNDPGEAWQLMTACEYVLRGPIRARYCYNRYKDLRGAKNGT